MRSESSPIYSRTCSVGSRRSSIRSSPRTAGSVVSSCSRSTVSVKVRFSPISSGMFTYLPTLVTWSNPSPVILGFRVVSDLVNCCPQAVTVCTLAAWRRSGRR